MSLQYLCTMIRLCGREDLVALKVDSIKSTSAVNK